ncbi:MAG: LLM class flavin-dependent oxidoreductase [Acidimicrobiales bacterium]|nr:LLM class flavin-dependent oxidoreductase [Acidimicrobiales bacterium]
MDLAVFTEIPVPRPWSRTSERDAYRDTLAQAVAADRAGFHSFWTTEHHFLEEMSHSSNPEVLYGAIAAHTSRIRIGYGVRLMPKPYNHPVRTAESVATLDLISDGRVEFGTGRSTTRAELEGFGIDPSVTREMWAEAIGHVVGCWTNDEYEFDGPHWSMPRRRVLPKPLQDPHPPLWGATGSRETHRLVGEMGLGLCSFAAGIDLDELALRISVYKEAVAGCSRPVGRAINDRAATFAMVHCAPTRSEALEQARRSFEWYPTAAFRNVASVAELMTEGGAELGDWNYLRYLPQMTAADDWDDRWHLEEMLESGVCVAGDPDDVAAGLTRFAALGVDLLLCMVNPYAMDPPDALRSIELIGRHCLPALA